jgi:hypothetical protein
MPYRTEDLDEEQEHVRLATAMLEAFRPLAVPPVATPRHSLELEAALQVIRFYADERQYELVPRNVDSRFGLVLDYPIIVDDGGKMARDFLQKRIDRK